MFNNWMLSKVSKKQLLLLNLLTLTVAVLAVIYSWNQVESGEKKHQSYVSACERIQDIDDELINTCKETFVDTVGCDADPNCDWDTSIQKFKDNVHKSEALEQEKEKIMTELEK